jgi:hypothetical protein
MKRNPIMGFLLFFYILTALLDLVDVRASNTLYIVVYTFASRKKNEKDSLHREKKITQPREAYGWVERGLFRLI